MCSSFRFLILLIPVYLISNTGSAQLTINMDKTGIKNISESVIHSKRKGDRYTLEINDINTYVFKVVINSKDTLFERPVQVPGFSGFNIGSLAGLMDIISPPSISIEPTPLKFYESELPKIERQSIQILKTRIKRSFNLSSNKGVTRNTLIENLESSSATLLKNRIKKENETLLVLQVYRDEIDSTLREFRDTVYNFNYSTQNKTFPLFSKGKKIAQSINETISKLNETQNQYSLDMQILSKSDKVTAAGHSKILEAYKLLITDYTSLKSDLLKVIEYLFVKRIEFEKANLRDNISSEITSIKDTTDKLQSKVMRWISESKLLVKEDGDTLNYSEYISTIDTLIKSAKNSSISTKTIVSRNQNSYIVETTQLNSFGALHKNILKSHNSVLSTYDSIYKNIDKIIESLNVENVSRIQNLIVDIANNSNRSYMYTGQVGEGQTILTVNIIPRDSTLRLQSYNTTFTFPVQKTFYWGTGLGLYFTNFKEDRYSFQESISGPDLENLDTTFIAIQEDSIVHEIGIHASINFGWYLKKNPDWGIGISIGPGITFADKIKPRILYGANISYGSRNRIYLGIGGISGYVDKTSNAVPADLQFASKPESLVVSKLSTRFSISMGYFYTF